VELQKLRSRVYQQLLMNVLTLSTMDSTQFRMQVQTSILSGAHNPLCHSGQSEESLRWNEFKFPFRDPSLRGVYPERSRRAPFRMTIWRMSFWAKRRIPVMHQIKASLQGLLGILHLRVTCVCEESAIWVHKKLKERFSKLCLGLHPIPMEKMISGC